MSVIPVVEFDGMSAVKHKPVNICDVCGFQWVRRPGPDPDRCASQDCRSVFWNRGKKAVAEWEKRKRKPGRPRKGDKRGKAKRTKR